MQEIIFRKPRLHFFVCINDRTGTCSTTPSCGPRIKPEDVKAVKQWVREQGWTLDVYVTQAKCLGFCNEEGSVACVYPKGKFVKGIQDIDDIKKFIFEEVKRV